MAEEIVFKTRVDTGNTVDDVNSITKAIKQTETEVDKLSKAYGENSKEADAARKKLAKLDIQLAATKGSATDLGATFEDVYGEIKPMTGRIGELEDRLYEMALAGDTASKEFKDLQAETVRLKQTIISVDKAVDQLQESGKGLGTALQIGDGVVAGYAAVQGAIGLMGVENEELEKTIVKVQSAQALLNGIQQLKLTLDSKSMVVTKAALVWDKIKIATEYAYSAAIGTTTGAMKILRIAMLAIPIVAIIAGIVALIAIITSFMGATKSAKEENDALNKSFEQQTKILDRQNANMKREIENRLNLAKARGKSQDEINKIEEEGFLKEENNRIESIKALKFQLAEKKRLHLKAIVEGEEDTAKEISDEIKSMRTKYLDLRDLDGQYQKDKQIRQAAVNSEERKKLDDQNKKLAEQNKKAYEKSLQDKKDADAKLLALYQLTEDLIINNLEDQELKRLETLRISQERERALLIEKYGKDTELLKAFEIRKAQEIDALNAEITKKRADDAKALSEAEIAKNKAIQDKINADVKAGLDAKLLIFKNDFEETQLLKEEQALIIRDQELMNTELTENQKWLIQEQYIDRLDALKEESAEKEKARQKAVQDASIQIAEQGIESIQNLSDLVFEIKSQNGKRSEVEELKSAKKQFKINKALQLVGATIDGAKAVTASLAQAPIAIGAIPNPAGIASLAFAISSTAATIAKISSTQFSGGGSVSAPSSAGISGGSNGGSSQGGGQNTNSNTSQVSSVGLTNNQTGVKVTVVDSEIKAVMDASAQTNVISTIGGG